MAFYQPIFAPSAQPTSAPSPEQQAVRPSLQTHPLEDSREWVLFPSRQSAGSYTQATSTDRTPRTAGLSRLSDFGSLNSGGRSGEIEAGDAGAATNQSLEEEDEGLDSLDEGLHAFQAPSKLLSEHFHASSNSILPRHDGLGGFPTTSTPALEEHGSWLPGRDDARSRKRSFGPQRRRTSINMERGVQETMLEDDQSPMEEERRERIEKWRLDHSRVLLNEIEKETRRRRASFRGQKSLTADEELKHANLERSQHIVGDQHEEGNVTNQPGVFTTTHHAETEAEEESESVLERVTRLVIRDFMGIDDKILSVILGESLVDEEKIPPAKAPRLGDSTTTPTIPRHPMWERRLIDRVNRELGMLFHQLSDRPSATIIPKLFDPTSSDYAGLPIPQPTTSGTHRQRPALLPAISAPQVTESIASPNSFIFNPTLQDAGAPSPSPLETASHAALWGIEEEPSTEPSQQSYWESPPTLKEIFQRFLQSRFPSYNPAATSFPSSSSSPSLRQPTSSHTRNIATTSTPDILRRAALIRQHHPLTSNRAAHHRRRRSWLRRGSSCASESAARRSTVAAGRSSVGTGTSRNYWDLGAGGGGSSIASSGVGVGVWGEA